MNKVILKNSSIFILLQSFKIVSLYREYSTFQKKTKTKKLRRIQFLSISHDLLVGFFNGVAQEIIMEGWGVGGMIKLSGNIFLYFKIGLGYGTNTKSKLIAIWALVTLAKIRIINCI